MVQPLYGYVHFDQAFRPVTASFSQMAGSDTAPLGYWLIG
jgi:hypothetical protein